MCQRKFRRAWVFVLCLATCLAGGTAPVRAADAGADLVAEIVKLLGHPDREFRAAALEQIRNAAPGKAHTLTFAAQMPKLDPSAQAALITALGGRGDAAARPAVTAMLGSSQEEAVRASALAALGEIGSTEDLPALEKALSAGTGAERQAARTALVRMRGKAVVQQISADSQKAAPPLRAALIEILATRRAVSETPALIAASIENEAQVRSAAMNALGLIGSPDQLSKMIPGVLKAQKGGERDAAERSVAAVCTRIPDENQRAEALIAALDQTAAAERDQLLGLVGRVGGKRLINYVGEIASGDDAARRTLGIDALSKWPDASPADKLLELAEKAQNASERQQAFQGYVKISSTRDNRSDKERLQRMQQAMKAARTPEEEATVINRARTAYAVETLRFVLPYTDKAEFAQLTCETIVELAHHREIRDPNKAEFDKALDKVIQLSKDPEVIDRAQKYKRGETWVRPKK